MSCCFNTLYIRYFNFRFSSTKHDATVTSAQVSIKTDLSRLSIGDENSHSTRDGHQILVNSNS